MSGIVTAIVLFVEWTTGAQLRDDLLGRLVRLWLGIGVSAQLVADHNAIQVIVAGVGVVLIVATVVSRRRAGEANATPANEQRTSARELIERAEQEARSRLREPRHG